MNGSGAGAEAQSLPAGAVEKIRGIPGNDTCMDCGAEEPDWGDVLHGSLHCAFCGAYEFSARAR